MKSRPVRPAQFTELPHKEQEANEHRGKYILRAKAYPTHILLTLGRCGMLLLVGHLGNQGR